MEDINIKKKGEKVLMVEVEKVEILVRMTLTLTKSGGGKAYKCFRIQHKTLKNTLKLQSACRIALDGEGGDMGGGEKPLGSSKRKLFVLMLLHNAERGLSGDVQGTLKEDRDSGLQKEEA